VRSQQWWSCLYNSFYGVILVMSHLFIRYRIPLNFFWAGGSCLLRFSFNIAIFGTRYYASADTKIEVSVNDAMVVEVGEKFSPRSFAGVYGLQLLVRIGVFGFMGLLQYSAPCFFLLLRIYNIFRVIFDTSSFLFLSLSFSFCGLKSTPYAVPPLCL